MPRTGQIQDKNNSQKFFASFLSPQNVQRTQIFVLSLGSCYLIYESFSEHYLDESKLYFATARSMGNLIKRGFPLVFLPTMRMLDAKFHSLIQTRKINELINRRYMHKLLGSGLYLSGLVHTGAHVLNRGIDSISLKEQEWVTGAIMMALLTLPILGGYLLQRSPKIPTNFYLNFLLPHQFGWWLLLGFFALHTQDFRLLPTSMMILLAFSMDRLFEWAKSRSVSVLSIQKIHGKMVELTLSKPDGYVMGTGGYALLAHPWYSYFFNSSHPFTIASSKDENHLQFIISENGPWTREKINQLQPGDTLTITPPFPSHLPELSKISNPVLLISSGAGMALSVAYLRQLLKRGDNPLPIKLALIHISRERGECRYLHELLKEVKQSQHIKAIHEEYFNTSQIDEPESTKKDSFLETKGRFKPKTHPFYNTFKGLVFFCGNPTLGKKLAKTENPERKLFNESFSF